MVKINIVELGNKVGAVKLGKCPMFAVADFKDKKDFVDSIREDFPDCIIQEGKQPERQALAQFIIRSKQR